MNKKTNLLWNFKSQKTLKRQNAKVDMEQYSHFVRQKIHVKAYEVKYFHSGVAIELTEGIRACVVTNDLFSY